MIRRDRVNIVDTYGILFTIIALLIFVCMVIFGGCTSKEEFPEAIKNNDSFSSFTGECEFEPCGDSSDSAEQIGSNISSSSEFNNSGPNHPPELPIGYGCNYNPIWCDGMAFDKVKTISITDEVGATTKGQERPNCVYAKAIIQIGNEDGGISINGTQFANQNPSRCGGDSGHGWGDPTPCATKFASVAKVDGGYYIYISKWAGQNFKTTGGEPVCTGNTNPGTSNPSQSSSSVVGGNTSTCVDPMNGVPPNGVKSCIKKDGKCYTCNPDRGNDCLQGWVWQGGNVSDQWWYKEVPCDEPSTPTYNLTCTGLAQTGIAGTAIAQPTVKCNGDNATATFTGAPNWSNPTANTYTVSATANCGGSKTVSCGTLVVSAAPTATTLTCTGLAQTGIAGTAITQPTVKCGTSTVSNPAFTGAPNWSNPSANTYTVSANATGACTQAASCGTIKVSPKLTCDALTTTSVIAGTAVTPPTVKCGTNTVTNISWSGAPSWNSPDVGTYSNIKATANAGDCSNQTATCSGTLTVNPKLTCGSVSQTITTGQIPTKPPVSCGTTTITNSITWDPTSINGVINTAQTISNVKATASCGGSNQTATCSGTITVTAPAPSSSSGGGGGGYQPLPPGSQSAKTTQYWDACKPSCSWSTNAGGKPANACNITGNNIGHSDGDKSACDGGPAFACMNQAPWKASNGVSFGYAAINMGSCGDCYQLDFPNGHVMVVMKSNIGNLNEGAAFDLMIPGGGVGDFDALTRQVINSGVSNPNMGERYGGFRGACGWQGPNVPNCVRGKCNDVFKNLSDLKAGCNWYPDNLGTDDASFNNPTVKYQKVNCPSELTNRY